MGRIRMTPVVIVIGALTIIGSACSSKGGTAAAPTSGATTSAPTTAAPTESESTAADSGEVTLVAPANASTLGFETTEVAAPAGKPFTITFENKDPGIPHNVVIYAGTDTSKDPVWAPKGNATVTGVGDTKYEIPALDAGVYTFTCSIHAAVMTGTLTVQ